MKILRIADVCYGHDSTNSAKFDAVMPLPHSQTFGVPSEIQEHLATGKVCTQDRHTHRNGKSIRFDTEALPFSTA
jgi:hypothetical protein